MTEADLVLSALRRDEAPAVQLRRWRSPAQAVAFARAIANTRNLLEADVSGFVVVVGGGVELLLTRLSQSRIWAMRQ